MRLAGTCLLLGGFLILPVVAEAQGTARPDTVGGGSACAPVVLQPAGIDSASVAPLLAELTETLTRRFRPPTPDDTAARLVLTVTSDDIRFRNARSYEARIQPAARLAVAGAKIELPRFKNPPGATPIQFVASFEPHCVTEFPAREPQAAYFELQVPEPARLINGVVPTYPPALLAAHVEGSVLVQFVIDTAGVPDRGTFKVLMSSNDLFSEAVRKALPLMRFKPATIGERRVQHVVQMPFTFAER